MVICRRLFLIGFLCAGIICIINIGWFDSSRPDAIFFNRRTRS